MLRFIFNIIKVNNFGVPKFNFWVFFEESELYTKEKGLHINWSRHLQISIFKDTYLEGNCFPQGYYSDYVDNDSDFNAKFNGALNKAKVRLVPEGTSEDGKWIWVICSVSYYDRFFYFNGNSPSCYWSTN